MRENISYFWENSDLVTGFSAAVCLHGHTMHSEECLSFLPGYLHHVPGVSRIVRSYQRGSQPVDFARAWWTPPLTPASALRLEQDQIAKLGLRPIVSLTDHDNVEAGLTLQVAADPGTTPVSVEWTVPFRRSIFHVGIHNLPPAQARDWLSAMAAYTAAPEEAALREIMSECHRIPEALIVLNHPFWLEEGVEASDHLLALPAFIQTCAPWLHAFEWNGTRRWHENAATVELAREHATPVISGGDRHACEPAACLNLTNARSFSEFAAEVRTGQSAIVIMPHYREPMPLRILEASWDILRPYPEYPGRERWTDRIFYRCEDGAARPLSAIWKDRIPWVVMPVTGMVQFFASSPLRGALRFLLSRRAQVQP